MTKVVVTHLAIYNENVYDPLLERKRCVSKTATAKFRCEVQWKRPSRCWKRDLIAGNGSVIQADG